MQNFPVEERTPVLCMCIILCIILCLLVEDVDIVISFSSSHL